MMEKRILAGLCAALLFLVGLTGCGKPANYADGTYEGQSSVYEGDESGAGEGYGVATVTVKDNVVVACEFRTYQTDGTLKDEDYGKADGVVANQDYYNKAQRAVVASQKYAEQLAEVGELNKVDAISGATISFHEFNEAVENALRKAAEG